GYEVRVIDWGPDILRDLAEAKADLVFNVSSLVEAAILEELEMPFVGSDSFAIALATDKSLAKKLWEMAGLPTSPFHVARTEEDCEIFRDAPPFPYPLFIKPVAGRGSAGITEESVVENYDQLVKGVRERYRTIGQPVLIERFLSGREVTQCVLGNNGDVRVLSPLEIKYAEGSVTLTFDKKELDDDTFVCPAPLSDEEMEMMADLAKKAYSTLGMKDFGRIDAFLTDEGPFLLEANTFAGLMCTPVEKPHSYVGIMAVADGMNGKDLLDEIVKAALTRYQSC
ncbi:MAG: ATP-grasp domain-containing protein, partial [Nitrospiraceae bacterium]|nr:ATP-grasp domain-containing protein [Nitrospiraceae bacterium]